MNGVLPPNGAGPFQMTPELQQKMQQLNFQQQKQMLDIMAQLEVPTVIINTVNLEPMGAIGVKLVFGESPGNPALPIKARSAVAVPWPVAINLIEGLSKAAHDSGIIVGPANAAE